MATITDPEMDTVESQTKGLTEHGFKLNLILFNFTLEYKMTWNNTFYLLKIY